MFGQLFAAFLGQGRDTDTDNFTVVFRHDAQFGIYNRFFDDAEHVFVPRLDGDAAGIGRVDGCHIIDGYHGTVGIHTDAVEQTDISLSRTDVRQGFVQIHYRHVHFLLRFVKDSL